MRIAEREDGVLRSRTPGDRLEDVDGRGQADYVVDRQRRVLDEEIARMQHEAAAGLDRAALQHLHGLGVFRQLDLLGLLDDVELHQQFRKIDGAGGMVDNDAHGAFGGMRADVNHRTRKARVSHHRHGDQQLAVEIAAIRRIVAAAGGLAANNSRSFACRVHRKRTLVSIHILISGAGSVNQASRRVKNYITSNSMVCASACL
jgi:hypothetical protein